LLQSPRQPRNDEGEGNIDDLLNLEKEECITKVVDEYTPYLRFINNGIMEQRGEK